jgi:hypothetical protein
MRERTPEGRAPPGHLWASRPPSLGLPQLGALPLSHLLRLAFQRRGRHRCGPNPTGWAAGWVDLASPDRGELKHSSRCLPSCCLLAQTAWLGHPRQVQRQGRTRRWRRRWPEISSPAGCGRAYPRGLPPPLSASPPASALLLLAWWRTRLAAPASALHVDELLKRLASTTLSAAARLHSPTRPLPPSSCCHQSARARRRKAVDWMRGRGAGIGGREDGGGMGTNRAGLGNQPSSKESDADERLPLPLAAGPA